eukprot:9184308-Pyramimonas_sp.AAC.1
MAKTAKLAVLFFCQPSGGSAARSGNVARGTRTDGYAEREATINELVMYRQNWAPFSWQHTRVFAKCSFEF